MTQLGAVIGTDHITTSGFVPVVDPSTGSVFAETADCGPAEVDHAVQAAQAASVSWKRRPVAERAAV
ncbi:MAG: aldehyde dehydrogenase family protein, partial [Actinomycetota bacterium]|nr:aldehyde dehydrogenase family protein [Actinomycetota bacterium]